MLPPPDEPSSRRIDGQRKSSDSRSRWTALAPDRAVGMAAARGEIVGADDGRAAVDLAPAADVVGGGEAGDPSILVVVREAREAADLAKAAGVEQQVDPLAAGQLAAIALADHARIVRIGREAAMGDRLQRLHVGKQRRPGVVAIVARRGWLHRRAWLERWWR